MNREHGLTLVELLTAVAVMAVTVSVAVPAFERQARLAAAQVEVQKLLSVLVRARGEAVKRNRVVTLCGSGDGVSCGGDWNRGWLLFVDDDCNGRREPGEHLLAEGAAGHGYRLRLAAFGSAKRLKFNPVGLVVGQNGTFRLCPADGDVRYARAVVISRSGRMRVTRDLDGDGVPEGAGGKTLSCS